MKILRSIPVIIAWVILGISVAFFMAATGIGWFGEQVMKLGFEN